MALNHQARRRRPPSGGGTAGRPEGHCDFGRWYLDGQKGAAIPAPRFWTARDALRFQQVASGGPEGQCNSGSGFGLARRGLRFQHLASGRPEGRCDFSRWLWDGWGPGPVPAVRENARNPPCRPA